ncbi:two-component system response regulator QseB [Paraburkholderia sp. BL6669N2]|uniref:winged helix-turn-helix domain-containing protein n=1 Tax=Paraburkholderia sp. BL6669N2 TaxID=1938807 RepID=UPI000E24CCC9|nr:response regulator transcription factor [Paraburkholderia sp. BL6669N2]REG48406.1 two-component system response regulator QseB [Paraburkholderia sp. BL6669N2]
MRVLIYECDEALLEVLRQALRSRNYAVDCVCSGRDTELSLKTGVYDLIILGIEGQRDSLSILQAYRAAGHKTTVMAISSRGSVAERTAAFDAGADDCMAKPIDLDELQARIRALLRRRAGQLSSVSSHGALTLDDASCHTWYDGELVTLAAREYALVHIMLSEPTRFFSAAELEAKVYGWGDEVQSNTIQVHIRNLRKKLGNEFIEARYGAGYRLALADTTPLTAAPDLKRGERTSRAGREEKARPAKVAKS